MTDVFDPAGEADPESQIARDQWDRYVLPDPTGKTDKPISTKRHGRVKGKAFTRATTFAKSIMDNYTLHQWQQRMVVKGITMRPDLYALAAATPLADREALNKIAEDAKEAAGAKSRATIGTALHAFTEQADQGKTPAVPAQWSPEVAAYAKLVKELGIVFEPHLIERVVVVPEVGVAGKFDRVGRLTRDLEVRLTGLGMVMLKAGTYVMVDLKTGRDLSYGWTEIVIQLALYAMAKKMWITGKRTLAGAYEPMPEIDQRVALVIHLPVRESPDQEAVAELHAVNLAQGRQAIELCAQVRLWRKTKELTTSVMKVTVAGDDAADLARAEKPAHITPVEEVPVSGPRPSSWADRIHEAASPAELSAIWREAKAKGQWTAELERLGRDQLSKIRTT